MGMMSAETWVQMAVLSAVKLVAATAGLMAVMLDTLQVDHKSKSLNK